MNRSDKLVSSATSASECNSFAGEGIGSAGVVCAIIGRPPAVK
jgi:hypothetical protein